MSDIDFSFIGDTQGDSPSSQQEQAPQQPSETPAGATSGDGQPGGEPQASVPSYRLREETERRQAVEQALAQAMQTIQQLSGQQQRQPQAQAPRSQGPQLSPEQREAIRQQFGAVFPELTTLADKAEALQQMLDNMPNVQAQQDYYWKSVGGQFIRNLQEQAVHIYGDNLSPGAKRQFELGFIDWVENDPQALQRYLAQDMTLVADFWKVYKAQVLDPVRRAAAANLTTQSSRLRQIPQSGPTSPPPGTRPAKPKNEDELHDMAFAALQSMQGE